MITEERRELERQIANFPRVWERRVGEPALWYQRFLSYLHQTNQVRSIHRMWNEERAKKGQAPTRNLSGTITTTASKYQWVVRAEQYDVYQALVTRLEVIHEREQEALHRRRILRQTRQALGTQVNHMVAGQDDKGRADTRMQDASLDVIIRGIRAVVELQRLEYGEDAPVQRVEVTGKDGQPFGGRGSGNVIAIDLERLTVDQMETLLAFVDELEYTEPVVGQGDAD